MLAARRDVIAGAVMILAILLFAGNASQVVAPAIEALVGLSGGADKVLTTALLLNIALLLFGWRRYKDLSREVRDRTAAEARASELALTDPLTGLLNRMAISERGQAMLERAAERRKRLAVALIDLDHFKMINDVNGHAIGDALLQEVARTIGDAMPPVSVTARIGGDEFACAFMFDFDSPESVDVIAERVVSQLSRPFDIGGVTVRIGASAGLAQSDEECLTFEALLRRADIAMHQSKYQGRNRYCWFDASMERELQTRNMVEAGLRDGIPLGQFVPYYEQQVDLTTGKLHGFEMLARWEHPTRGVIPPAVFIPVAEECGLISDLSIAVMRQAFEEAKNWDPSLSLSVNISPVQLKDPWLAQKIVKLLVETGFPANRLEVEITESSLFENLGLAQSIIGSLKNQGIRIALDDFGTGYSSLAHLRALPFDRIKIDRSFVSSINSNAESAAIVNAITRLAESLNLPIVAEGIEDGEIWERLKAIGCVNGQGWHFGKPMTVNQVRSFLAEKNLLPLARVPEPEPGSAEEALAQIRSARRAR